MQFRSIQNRILVLAGVAMTTALVILILLNQYSGRQTQQLTIDSSRAALQQEAWQKVSANARAEAATITQLLQKGLSYTQQMASVFARQQEGKLPLDRQQATDLLKAQLALEPQLYGAFAGFEPNGFDGQDESFAGQSALGRTTRGASFPTSTATRSRSAAICCSPSRRAIRTSSATRPTTTTPARNGRGAPASSIPSRWTSTASRCW